MTDPVQKYEIDGPVRQPCDGSDWHFDLRSVNRPYGNHRHFVCVQFSSYGVDEAEAEKIAKRMLDGLNQTPQGK